MTAFLIILVVFCILVWAEDLNHKYTQDEWKKYEKDRASKKL